MTPRPGADPTKLTAKEEKFALLYVMIGVASEAYQAAYDTHGARRTLIGSAAEVKRRPHVKAYIEKLSAERAARVGVKAEEILAEVRGLSLACETDRDRLTAYTLLGKALNMWSERTVLDIGSQTLEQMVLAADRLARDGAIKVAEALKPDLPPVPGPPADEPPET